MAQYLSPGVYVEEIPSAVQAIAGVSTSTAGFIGKTSTAKVVIPPGPVARVEDETTAAPAAATSDFYLVAYPVFTRKGTFRVWESTTNAAGKVTKGTEITDRATLENDFGNAKSKVVLNPPTASAITVSYGAFVKAVRGETVGQLDVASAANEDVGPGIAGQLAYDLDHSPVDTTPGTFHVTVTPAAAGAQPIVDPAGVTLSNPVSQVIFPAAAAPAANDAITVTYLTIGGTRIKDENVGPGIAGQLAYDLDHSPVDTTPGTFHVTVTPAAAGAQPIVDPAGVTLSNPVSQVIFPAAAAPAANDAITVTYKYIDRKKLQLASYPVLSGTFKQGDNVLPLGDAATSSKFVNDFRSRKSFLEVTPLAATPARVIMADYLAALPNLVVNKRKIGVGDASTTSFTLDDYPVDTDAGMSAIRVGDYRTAQPETNVSITNDDTTKKTTVTFTTAPPDRNLEIWADYIVQPVTSPLTNTVKLCTNFSEYRKHFGDFSADPELNKLANAVYGFFQNGGSRCYVGVMQPGMDDISAVRSILEQFEAVDEIAIVAAPGIDTADIRNEIVAHCKVTTQDRFAIFDSPEVLETDGDLDLTLLNRSNPSNVLPDFSDYAAFYFPWIKVADPVEKTMYPKGDGRIFVPPSGHVAGIYARVDNTRGVFKAPANEVILGALEFKYNISKAQQDGLNPQGVNCIREMNGARKVWGARTIGGDANGEWRYINVRRSMLFLRESIDEGTQWAVFEPNDRNLWAKITRNVSAFLNTQWRAGMLFGSTPQEAFYVKCDDETNPPELREIGQVVTEIGVAIVRPAEFVIFRISQWQPTQA